MGKQTELTDNTLMQTQDLRITLTKYGPNQLQLYFGPTKGGMLTSINLTTEQLRTLADRILNATESP